MQAKYIKQSIAKDFIRKHHRRRTPSTGSIFNIGLFSEEGKLCGAAMVGRPVSRELDNGTVIEITRMCTNGIPNGCSFLYGKCISISREFGFSKLITYTEIDEPGSSLRASGFVLEQSGCGSGDWTGSRRRNECGLKKNRWAYDLSVLNKKSTLDKSAPVLSQKQKSTLLWLNIMRHKFFDDSDSLFFTADPAYSSVSKLFPWIEYGWNGEINRRLLECGLSEIEFSTDLGAIQQLLPGQDGFFELDDFTFEEKYFQVKQHLDLLMQDMSNYLLRIDAAYKTDYAASINSKGIRER